MGGVAKRQGDVQAGDWKAAQAKCVSGQDIQAQASIATPASDQLRAYQGSMSLSMKHGAQRANQAADADRSTSDAAIEQLQKKLEVRAHHAHLKIWKSW